MSLRLLIADDHEVVRRGLVTLLSGTDVEIVAEASSPASAVDLAREHKPDVALLDIRMMDGGDDGLTALERIHRDLPEGLRAFGLKLEGCFLEVRFEDQARMAALDSLISGD